MKIYNYYRLSLLASLALILSILLLASVSDALPIKHIIQFGGQLGYKYSPNTMDVIVGDTVVWTGDFMKYDLVSVSVPPGAASFGPIKTGTSFSYVVQAAGDYSYKSAIYVSLGMIGSFHATAIHNGLSNEGREFYLAMIYPNYNTGVSPFFFTYAMINTYYENEVSVSYFDDVGRELPPKIYRVPAKGSLKLPLDRDAMLIDVTIDAAQSKSCHITSKRQITVEYLSIGPCSGGSYLALPVIALGKEYVAASFNDNPREGAISNPNNSGGAFIIIGTVDGTNVQITPATTTTMGHTGAIHGFGSSHTPVPYHTSLNKGQTYLVRSNGDDNENDMAGSIIEASNPIGVISGHENAFFGLGGVDPYSIEGRDYMVEQMVPYSLWESTGYISIPFVEALSPGDVGAGDTYRIYTFEDKTTALVHLGIGSGGDDLAASRFNFAEKKDVTGPTETYSTNGKKISVIQYDERSESKSKPWPAPSMMTVVPRSHWKKFYSFNLLDNGNVWQVIDLPYINVISDHIDDIRISIGGGAPTALSVLTKGQSFTNLSGSDAALSGTQYKLYVPPLSPPTPYYLTSEFPFMVYFYEMRDVAITGLGTNLPPNIPHEYAAPAGMQLNTGKEPTVVVTIDSASKCSGWHVCVRDTSTLDPGIRAIMLVDDPDGVYFLPEGKLQNVSFDTTSLGYEMGEYHPQVGGENFCFAVNVTDPLASATAPLAIVDNNGNAAYLLLHYKAPSLKLSTDPPTSSRADSIVFPVKAVGQQICTTFVFKNTADVGGAPITITSAKLKNNGNAFSISSATPPLPHTLSAQESDTVQLCYTPNDTLRHRDSLIIQTGCFAFSISLDAHGTTGLIFADDAEFGYVAVGKEYCKDIQVRNVGTAPMKILSLKLSDTADFDISVLSLAKLPLTIPKGASAMMKVCFHPKKEGPYSESLTFGTDLAGSFATSIKNFSYLSGTGALISAVKYDDQPQTDMLRINPNPAAGYSVIASFPSLLKKKSLLSITDVLGREVYTKDILANTSQVEVPIQNLPVGIYFVLLTSEDVVMSQKLEVLR